MQTGAKKQTHIQNRVSGTSKWDMYASGFPEDLSEEQKEVGICLF